MSGTVKFNGVDIPIKITYKSAWFELPELGIDILNIFDGEKTIMNILTNEKVMVELFYYYAKVIAPQWKICWGTSRQK